MSLQDQEAFLKSIHPFELLSKKEIAKAASSMNIAYYKKDTVLLSPNILSASLYIIIKGEVGEYQDDDLIKVYNKSNSFDADSLIYAKTENTFKTLEELICFELDKKEFLQLMDTNEKFKNYFLNSLANKIRSAKQKEYTTELSGFMIARVMDSYLHEPTIVQQDCSIMDALKQMEAKKSNCIIVKNNGEYGLVTDSVIRKHVIFNDYDKHAPIGPIALYPIITIEYDDYLFNALLSFTKNSIKRIIVKKDGEIFGILEQLDLLSYFANHSYLVAVQIRKATTIEELKQASSDLVSIVKKLHVKGTKVDYIAKLISEINEKIYEKLYSMIVPEELRNKACLIVMGSEGRKEQMLKTDQDNALIISNDVDSKLFEPYMLHYTETLIDFGFPECEGNIMVSNPYWRKSINQHKQELERWLESPQKDDYMNLAIFFDSIPVAGDKKMLEELKNLIFERTREKDVFMANFAKAALLFETPIGIFANLISDDNDLIDVKKGGIFPIVQGIRSLALENAITETDTITRIKKLVKLGILEENFAGAITEAFDTLLSLRLKRRLQKGDSLDKNHNKVSISSLNELELELLKDSLKIVNKFKKMLMHHFKINMVS